MNLSALRGLFIAWFCYFAALRVSCHFAAWRGFSRVVFNFDTFAALRGFGDLRFFCSRGFKTTQSWWLSMAYFKSFVEKKIGKSGLRELLWLKNT